MLRVGQRRPCHGGHGGGQVVVNLDGRAVHLTLDADDADIGAAGLLRIPLRSLKAGTGQLEDILKRDLFIRLIEQRIAGRHRIILRGGRRQQLMAIPRAAVRARVQVARANVGRKQIDIARVIQHSQARGFRHGEQAFGMQQAFAFLIIRNGTKHALVAEHGDRVLRHLHGDPLMAGIAFQIPGFLLIGNHERVGFRTAVSFHDLAVVFHSFARRSGNRRDIAADPRFGRTVLHIRISRLDAIADVGRHRAGHGHAHLVGDSAIPQALDERRGGVLIGDIRQRHFVRADGHGAARLFAVRIDDLLRLRGIPCIDSVADDGVAAGTRLLADVVARAGQRAGAGKGHDGGHRKAGRALEKVVHGISLHMTICHFLFEPILKFLRFF